MKSQLDAIRTAVSKQPVPPVERRIQQLLSLRQAVQRHEADILAALRADLGKSASEAWIELGGVLGEIELMVKELPAWSAPEKVSSPMVLQPGKSAILREPYGLVLILSPWNYPFQLALKPLVGALAAGNRVVVKPSEVSAKVCDVLVKLLGEAFPPQEVTVVTGGPEETQELLKERFDLVFFTGSTAVGRLVMQAAAQHLTPVVLELGGKSPCIVDETAVIKQAARRIVWGKFSNAGQTCVAPDYVLVHASVKDRLIDECRQALVQFYGENPKQSPDYGRIVSERHFDRLQNLLKNTKVVTGGDGDRPARYIAPTLVDGVEWGHPLMQEEIFGPILPFLAYRELDDALELVRQRPKPLALYVFSTDGQRQDKVMNGVSFGGGCVNDTIVHLGNHGLPFGGVGESGMGAYHGHHSFETFSHRKAVFQQTTLVDVPVRYPPYGGKEKLIKFLLG